MASYSDDGTHWTRTTNEIHPCPREYCVACNSHGCLASGTLLVDFFHHVTTYSAIPKGAMTAKWAVAGENICTLNLSITCASLGKASDVEASPEVPLPHEQTIPRLGTKPTTVALRCVFARWSRSSSTTGRRAEPLCTSGLRLAPTGRSRRQTLKNLRALHLRRKFTTR